MLRVLLSATVLLTSEARALAHDLEFTHTVVVFAEDGRFRADVTCDLDAIALGVPQGADSVEVVRELEKLSPGELERRIARVRDVLFASVLLRFDGEPLHPSVAFPQYGLMKDEPVPSLLGLSALFTGRVPEGARRFTIEVDGAFPPVYLTVMDVVAGELYHEVLPRGAESDPFSMEGRRPAAPPSRLGVALRYLRLGVQHIVPEGLDHVLFVLGLFLLSPRLRPLLLQVTAFTVAHTLTLALSSYGVVRLPSSVVEPLIALSIAYVGVENVVTRELKPWRPLVVFLFGLLHGMGFAGVLGELGLPRRELLVALLSFNAGVEAGQLVVLAGAFLTVGWLRNRSWYRSRVTVPLSIAVGGAGLYWAIERSLLG